MTKLQAILVDDEQDSRDILANYIAKYCPEVELLEKCNDVKSGLSAIKTHQPDIVFLDIEMPYGNGFDLLDQVDEVNFETIFVTAYNNYAVQALNRSAAYYLLKPIDIDELIGAVKKIIAEREKNNYTQHAKVLLENIQTQSNGIAFQKIMLPTLEGFEIVPIADIMYCEADDNFTRFHLVSKKELLICRTLKYFEETLADQPFVRVHRSHMINLNYVIRYTKGKGGYITMENHVELEVSPKKKAIFLEAFRR